MASIIQINQFLRRFRTQMKNKGFELVPRRTNLNTIASLGLSIAGVKSTIVALNYENYSEGPEVDEDGSEGEIWVFGVTIAGTSIYIKLKLDSDGAKCLSFHAAEFAIRKPYNLRGHP